MREPLVEIILVNYNNVIDTIECIDSLQNITYHNAHIIVVDNGSSNNSVEALRNKQTEIDFELICLKDNIGFSAGNNVAILKAILRNAQYILLLNNDTLVRPTFLSELVTFQEEHEECDVAVGKIYYASEMNRVWYAGGNISKTTSRTVHYMYGVKENNNKTDTYKEVSFATGCCLCIKARTFHMVGLLDEDYFLYDEDSDYCCRLARLNRRIFYVPSSIIYHKVSASTGKASPLAQYYTARNHFLLIDKNYFGIHKHISKFYTFLLLAKRCICKEINWAHTYKGIKAYYCGEKGKSI